MYLILKSLQLAWARLDISGWDSGTSLGRWCFSPHSNERYTRGYIMCHRTGWRLRHGNGGFDEYGNRWGWNTLVWTNQKTLYLSCCFLVNVNTLCHIPFFVFENAYLYPILYVCIGLRLCIRLCMCICLRECMYVCNCYVDVQSTHVFTDLVNVSLLMKYT